MSHAPNPSISFPRNCWVHDPLCILCLVKNHHFLVLQNSKPCVLLVKSQFLFMIPISCKQNSDVSFSWSPTTVPFSGLVPLVKTQKKYARTSVHGGRYLPRFSLLRCSWFICTSMIFNFNGYFGMCSLDKPRHQINSNSDWNILKQCKSHIFYMQITYMARCQYRSPPKRCRGPKIIFSTFWIRWCFLQNFMNFQVSWKFCSITGGCWKFPKSWGCFPSHPVMTMTTSIEMD